MSLSDLLPHFAVAVEEESLELLDLLDLVSILDLPVAAGQVVGGGCLRIVGVGIWRGCLWDSGIELFFGITQLSLCVLEKIP